MDKLLEGGIKQSWTYLAMKFLIFASLSAAIYFEVYSGMFTDERNY